MLSRFRRQVRGLAGRIRQLSRGLSVCRPGSLPPAPKFTALPGRRGAPWIGPRSPPFLYLATWTVRVRRVRVLGGRGQYIWRVAIEGQQVG